ncbi:MAG: hypothetical protein ACAF42_10460 [Limnothrix sp. BL-A-16]
MAEPPPASSSESSPNDSSNPLLTHRELPSLADSMAAQTKPKHLSPTRSPPKATASPAGIAAPPPEQKPTAPWVMFLVRFLAGALFGPLLAITLGIVGGATTGSSLLTVMIVSGSIIGLLSAVGGKSFWMFLSRFLRVIFFMR